MIDSREDFYAWFTPRNEAKPEIHGGFALAHWNGSAEVEAKIKDDLKVTIRCIPFEESRSPASASSPANRARSASCSRSPIDSAMKRTSAILLWISLLWSFLGLIFGVFSAILVYQLLHPPSVVLPSGAGVEWHRGNDTIEVMRRDFAGGTVIHVSSNVFFATIPVGLWLLVWLSDWKALRQPLGIAATWSSAVYLLFIIASLLWMEFLATTG